MKIERRTVLTVHCIEALNRVRAALAIPDPLLGYAPLPSKTQFICLALRETRKQDVQLKPACKFLEQVIDDRLGEFLGLESWLVNQVPQARYLCDRDNAAFDHQTYLTRLRWIDSLIAELEAGTL